MPSITNDTTLAFRCAVPISRTPVHRADAPSVARGQQRRLVRADRVEPDGPHVVDRRAEPDRAGDVRRAGLELVRQIVPGAALERDRPNHVAAAQERRHRVEHRLAAVQDADAGRAVHLVAGEHVEVRAERLDVHRPCDTRPATRRSARRRRPASRRATISATGLTVPSAFDTCTTATIFVRGDQQPLELLHHQVAAIVDRHDLAARRPCARTAAATARCWSGAPSPVMSTSSPAPTFASPQARATRLMLSVAFRVKTISWVDRALRKRAHLLARAFVGRRRALAEQVHAAVDVRVVLLVVAPDGVDDRRGFCVVAALSR